jgi:hypothetical protein
MKKAKKKKEATTTGTKRPQKVKLKGPGHYVPQFWIRGFRGANGRVLGRKRGEAHAEQIKVSKVMAEQGAYTLFDYQWNPSDLLEDLLADKHESHVAHLFRFLHEKSDLTEEVKEALCFAVGVAASRLPHVMKKGFKASNKIATLFLEVHKRSFDSFRRLYAKEAKSSITREQYDHLRNIPQVALVRQINSFTSRTSENPVLPQQATLEAAPKIAKVISQMDLSLLDASDGSFVLGDTPLPDHDLAKGFTLPLSSCLVLMASPKAAKYPAFSRRRATQTEIQAINRTQFDNMLEIIVGADKALLESF